MRLECSHFLCYYMGFSYCTSTPVPTLAVLPKPSWVTTKMPKTIGVRDSRDYTTLNRDAENDESTKTGTEDSGFEEWKQHVHQPRAPSPKGTHRTCNCAWQYSLIAGRDRASIIDFTLLFYFRYWSTLLQEYEESWIYRRYAITLCCMWTINKPHLPEK